MQGSRFDALTRWTSRRVTRRSAVSQLGTGLAAAFGLAALAPHPVTAQVASPVPEASPTAAVPVSLLFVQHAGPTTLTPGTGDIHTLTMTEVPAQTLYFSDRPNRVAGAEPTASFVDGFAEAFAGSPPNASLIGHLERGDDQEEAVVLTLRSAAYDEAAATLTYEVTLLDAELATNVAFEQEPLTVLDGPREYAEASLFIDSVGAPLLTGTSVVAYHITPEEDCSNYSPDFMCDVAKCEGTGPGPCDQQGTNCCDQVCDWLGSTSQYATFESCVDTDGDMSTALWSCECA